MLKVLKEGRLSEEEANEVKGFWPNSTVVRELAEQQSSQAGRPTTIAASTPARRPAIVNGNDDKRRKLGEK